jgi:TMEM175 potassium channel family protein
MEPSKPAYNLEISTQRLEAFSDGVFAIAITLLVLEIKVPDHAALAGSSLGDYLWHYWPKYFAYILSFISIGIYWANHHYLFKLFKRTDHIFNMLNVLFLMTIAFLPFPTAVLGEYILEPAHKQTAITFYCLGIAMPAVCWLAFWLYGSFKGRLTDHHLKDTFISQLTRRFILSNVLYISAVIISLIDSTTAITLNVVITLLYLLPPAKPQYA